jgi:hypothetical protein
MPVTRLATGVGDSTMLFAHSSEGNRDLEARLMAQIYMELHPLTGHSMRPERANNTPQPIALINEVFAAITVFPYLLGRTGERDWNIARMCEKRELSGRP